jgi:PAS domain S-box-containing protein
MNYYDFIPLAAFTISTFTWTYIFAQRRTDPVNSSYLMFAGALALWSMSAFIMWSYIPDQWLTSAFKISSLIWLPAGFYFLNFTYALLKKHRDHTFYIFLSLSMVSIIISLSTNLIISGHTEHYWGTSQKSGILFLPAVFITLALPAIYALYLIHKEREKVEDENTRKQLDLVFQGTSILALVGIFSDVIFPEIFGMNHFLRVANTGTLIQSIFIFRAVAKYNFLSIGIEESAHALFNNVEDGIILIDKNGHIIQMNDSLKYILHIKEINIDEMNISSIFAEYNQERDYKNHEIKIRVNSEQKTVSLSQATVKQKDVDIGKILIVRDITESKNAERELQASKKKLENLAGELRQANTSLEQKVAARTRSLQQSNQHLQREIAERAYAEQALAAEKERLAVTLSSIGDGVITTDTTGRIVLLNTVAAKLTGWQPERAVGAPLLDVFRIFDDKIRTPRPNPVEEVLRANTIINRTRPIRLIAGDGAEHLIAKTMAPIRDQNGRVIGVVLVFRDVTERQRIEEELIKTERLESIGVLAGGIAHDFNNILTAILGNISLAKMYASADEKTATRLANAEKAALRAQDLTQQLLTFSKGGTPVKQLASIKELIKDAVDFSLRGSNVRCDLFLRDDLWAADIDAGQISQVIHNLIINANQAMPNGGILEVHAENVTVNDTNSEYLLTLKQGQYVKISIKDQGVGIEEERLQKIFDPYFTTKQTGSGLGLFTSYSIIKKHDGYIDVASTVGVGTTFHIYLPASQKSVASQQPGLEEPIMGKGRILVMEDEADLRDVMGTMLAHFGYEVTFANHGNEAITAYQNAKTAGQPFDVIVLDLTIPGGMGGKETITQILAFDPHVKAIVASGYATDPIMDEFKQYGFCGCIAKPYKAHELNQILHTVIRGSTPQISS